MYERPFSRWSLLVGLAVAVSVLSACTSDDSDPETQPETAPTQEQPSSTDAGSGAAGEPMDLSVLVYNIEYGGNASTDKVMRTVDADVVGVLESYNRLPEIAAKTGYPYYNVGLQLLSKYPILEPSGADGLYALIEVRPGEVIAFFNTHLDYVAYGPDLLEEGDVGGRRRGVGGRGARVRPCSTSSPTSRSWPRRRTPCSSPATSTSRRASTTRRRPSGRGPVSTTSSRGR